jgi:hypothetical protein
VKKRRAPFSAWGWAGVVLLIIGIILLIVGFLSENPEGIELIGSICSIVALIWVFADNRINGMREEMGGMREEMGGMREEMRGMRQETREMRQEMAENFDKLPRRIAEELRELLKS